MYMNVFLILFFYFKLHVTHVTFFIWAVRHIYIGIRYLQTQTESASYPFITNKHAAYISVPLRVLGYLDSHREGINLTSFFLFFFDYVRLILIIAKMKFKEEKYFTKK